MLGRRSPYGFLLINDAKPPTDGVTAGTPHRNFSLVLRQRTYLLLKLATKLIVVARMPVPKR